MDSHVLETGRLCGGVNYMCKCGFLFFRRRQWLPQRNGKAFIRVAVGQIRIVQCLRLYMCMSKRWIHASARVSPNQSLRELSQQQ